MRTLTIAQRREMQLIKFSENYIHDIEKARKIVNSYYRYIALESRVDELDTEENQEKRWYKNLCEKENRWYSRLSDYLKPYGLCLFRPWCNCIIAIKDENGGIKEECLIPICY